MKVTTLLWARTLVPMLLQCVSRAYVMVPFPARPLYNFPKSALTAEATSTRKQSRSSLLNPQTAKAQVVPTKEADTEVYGAKFFGGSAVKEELFDPQVEESATIDAPSYTYSRFQDARAFPDDFARRFAYGLQQLLNSVLYEGSDRTQDALLAHPAHTLTYAPNLQWNSPFRTASSRNPLDEIITALLFYKRLDIAVISSHTLSNTPPFTTLLQVRWAISLLWPNILQSRVLLTGVSTINVQTRDQDMVILSQTDKLDMGGKDGRDLVDALASQLQPRFWDLYHISATPSAEIMPRRRTTKNKPNIFSPYTLFEIPPSLVYQTTLLDSGSRNDRYAQYIPNHAFTSFIKTMGPQEQRYVPTSPIEINIRRTTDQTTTTSSSSSSSSSTITWTIQISPEFISYSSTLPLPELGDSDDDDPSPGSSKYMYRPQRLVATIPHGGNPQDVDIADIRKTLYQSVVQDGFKPCLDELGKPIFFYLQNDVKACFTSDGGLGMAVYEWRPKSFKSNEVGIELEDLVVL